GTPKGAGRGTADCHLMPGGGRCQSANRRRGDFFILDGPGADLVPCAPWAVGQDADPDIPRLPPVEWGKRQTPRGTFPVALEAVADCGENVSGGCSGPARRGRPGTSGGGRSWGPGGRP